ncbi:MAG: hypothetical protein V7638_3814 [Acidobacteriota bacterium]|jgi:uncharacterized phage protein (TIGR02218 family)
MPFTQTNLTQLWTLIRGANVVRKTTWDQPINYTFDGNLYTPAAMQPTRFEEQLELSPNQLELSIDLTATGITESALTAGTWDRARLIIQVIDRSNLALAPKRKWQGILSRSDVVNGQLARSEFLSISHLFTQPIGQLYSPLCRVKRYGDTECGKDITSETFTGAVTSITNQRAFRIDVATPGAEENYFQYGTLLFTSGDNVDLELEVKTSVDNAGTHTDVTIVQDFPFIIELGDTISIVRGCNREFETCIARGQVERFRGEPNIPGVYKLLRRFPE